MGCNSRPRDSRSIRFLRYHSACALDYGGESADADVSDLFFVVTKKGVETDLENPSETSDGGEDTVHGAVSVDHLAVFGVDMAVFEVLES